MRHHVGAGTRTPVLCKSSQGSYPLVQPLSDASLFGRCEFGGRTPLVRDGEVPEV